MHLDPKISTTLPQEVLDRLIKNEARQRYRTNRINKDRIAANIPPLPCEKVDIIAIADMNGWTCGCHKVSFHTGCYKRVDVTKKGIEEGAPIVAHIVARSLEGGHTNKNCDLMRSECNAAISRRIETSKAAKYKRQRKKAAERQMDDDGGEAPQKFKRAIPAHSRGLQGRSKWQKGRKLQSRPFQNRKPQ